MSNFELKDFDQKIKDLMDFDGIVLAVWGMKPNFNKEKFVVNFDISIDIIYRI